jgi:hypothetical protein
MIPSGTTPIVVIILACVAALKAKGSPTMTPERRIVFDTLMTKCKDSAMLRKMADVFDEEGLSDPWAKLLRQRADLRDAPEEVKKQRRDVMKKALQSKNPDAVEGVAKAFESIGATGVAHKLTEYAKGLRAQPNPVVEPVMPAKAPEPKPEAKKPEPVKEKIPEVKAEVVS